MSQAEHSLKVESLEGGHVNNCILWWERHISGEFVLCFERMIALIYTLIAIRCSGSETGIASNRRAAYGSYQRGGRCRTPKQPADGCSCEEVFL